MNSATPPLPRPIQVPVGRFDLGDTSLCLLPREEEPDQAELDRVGRSGILTPPLVLERGAGFLPLTRRAAVAAFVRIHGEGACPALLMPPDLSGPDFFSLFLDHLLAQQGLSVAEQAGFVRLAMDRLGETGVMALLPRMGIPAQDYHLENLLRLSTLAPPALMALHQGRLHPKAARLLPGLAPADQERLTGIITATAMGGNRQRRLLELVQELGLRHGLAVDQVLDQARAALDAPRPAEALIQALEQWANPLSSAAEAEFQRFVARLQPPAGVTLTHTPAFEDHRVTLCFTLNDREALQAFYRAAISHYPGV